MSYKQFKYTLKEIRKAKPVLLNQAFDGKIFRFDHEFEEKGANTILTVKSNTTVDLNGLQVFSSMSIYEIPMEQPVDFHSGNFVLAELIYQHLSRDTDMIWAVSNNQIILTVPTIKEILDMLVTVDN